ncbi:MAG TPA: DUF4157 domain-containing protein [Blastocatellia bacterium]|nr:DUF4157 domain-containing protein [Blastocatellia bacterium]
MMERVQNQAAVPDPAIASPSVEPNLACGPFGAIPTQVEGGLWLSGIARPRLSLSRLGGSSAASGLVLRKCACGGGAGVTDKCADCDRNQLGLQRKPNAAGQFLPVSSVEGASREGTSSESAQRRDLPQAATQAPKAPGHGMIRVSSPNDQLEREADLIAQHVMSSLSPQPIPGSPLAGPLAKASSTGKTALARATIHRQADSSPESATPSTKAAAIQAPAAAPSGTAGSPLIAEDGAKQLAPGQMRKSQFLDALQAGVCSAADAELAAAGRSTKGCPYLEKWIGHYRTKDGRHLERSLRKFAPEAAGVKSASDYIPIVSTRIRRSVSVWARTGKITGVPEELAGEMAGGGLLGALSGLASGIGSAVSSMASGIGKAVSSIGSVFFKAREGGTVDADPGQIHSRLGTGQPLDGGVKQRMEAAFGHSFSHVRVHNDASGAELSANLNAKAFTLGEHVAFGSGEYRPGTIVGDALIAHELAHVVQQGGAHSSPLRTGEEEQGALEQDADLSAVGAVASIWGGVPAARDVGANSIPRLRSGLRLSRCGNEPKGSGGPSQTYEDCSPCEKDLLQKTVFPQAQSWINAAVPLVDELVANPDEKDPPNPDAAAPTPIARTRKQLKIHFGIKDVKSELNDVKTVQKGLADIRDGLSGEIAFHCHAPRCEGTVPAYTEGGSINVCARFFKNDEYILNNFTRSGIVIHEMAHRFGKKKGEVKREIDWDAYRDLPKAEKLNNADSYAQFARYAKEGGGGDSIASTEQFECEQTSGKK